MKLYERFLSGLKKTNVDIFDALVGSNEGCVINYVPNLREPLKTEPLALRYADRPKKSTSFPRISDRENNRHFKIDPKEELILMFEGSGFGFWYDQDNIQKILYSVGSCKDVLQEFSKKGFLLVKAKDADYPYKNQKYFENRKINVNEWYDIISEKPLELSKI